MTMIRVLPASVRAQKGSEGRGKVGERGGAALHSRAEGRGSEAGPVLGHRTQVSWEQGNMHTHIDTSAAGGGGFSLRERECGAGEGGLPPKSTTDRKIRAGFSGKRAGFTS